MIRYAFCIACGIICLIPLSVLALSLYFSSPILLCLCSQYFLFQSFYILCFFPATQRAQPTIRSNTTSYPLLPLTFPRCTTIKSLSRTGCTTLTSPSSTATRLGADSSSLPSAYACLYIQLVPKGQAPSP